MAIGFLIVLTKPGSNCSLLPLKAPEEDANEKIQKMSVSLAAAEEISVGAAVVAVFVSELVAFLH